MRTGQYAYRHTDISIGGDSESTGLALVRSNATAWDHAFGNFSHNWVIELTEKRINYALDNYTNGSGSDYEISVRFGGRSQTFVGFFNTTQFIQMSHGTFATLTPTGSPSSAGVVYTFRARDGGVAVFRPLGGGDCVATDTARCAYVSQVTEPDGTVFSFDYDVNPSLPSNRAKLRSVTSSRGYGLILENGTLGITKACVLNLAFTAMPPDHLCPAGAAATATYAYTNFAGTRLASVMDPSGAVWHFTYSGMQTNLTMGYVRPGETSAWLTNSLFLTSDEDQASYEAVSLQNFADGTSYAYSYDHAPVTGSGPATIAGGTYTDGLGHLARVTYGFPIKPGTGPGSHCTTQPCPPPTLQNTVYQVTPSPVAVTDMGGNTTTAGYCDPNVLSLPPEDNGGCLVTVIQFYTDAEGRRTDVVMDGRRNVITETRHALAGSGLPDLVRHALYNDRAEPTQVIDANGNETDYTYSPAHAGPLTETGPAVNGIRPQTRHDYAQRYAWVSNGAGGYVRAATPVWVETATSTCRTSAATGNPAAPCAVAGDEVRTTYDYGPDAGPNNLLLRGRVVSADGVSLRTCYGYDAMGRRISETLPNANLTSCP
jgi:YD repeat-containing protein